MTHSRDGNRRRRSVALRYDESAPAPIVLARGEGELAERLIEIARASGVPVVHSDRLAETLSVLEPGSLIPESFYEVIAELLVFVWREGRTGAEKVWDEKHQGD